MGIRISSSSIKAYTTNTDLDSSVNRDWKNLSIEGEILQSLNLKNFSFRELKTATKNFRSDSLLGHHGNWVVFRGWIDQHSLTPINTISLMAIAVKKLNQENFQGRKEWLGEINYLGKLQHPNLVKLIGYCYEDNHRLLVFEFISRGSMENHLFMRGPLFQPLSWDLRMKIALGAAKGLAFLHSADVNVIYGGFKTSNILLDSNYNAKLSNFYLARDGLPDDESYVSTPVVGTNSYVAQGYFSTGHLMAKSDDVYSLGVVLLEILFGRRAIDVSQPSKQRDLVKWAKRYYWTNKLSVFYILDPCFDRWRLFRRAEKLANLALHCLNDEPKFRPEMDDVVMVLEGLQ